MVIDILMHFLLPGELVQVLNHHGLRDRVDGSDLSHYIYHNLGAYDSETDNDTEETKGKL